MPEVVVCTSCEIGVGVAKSEGGVHTVLITVPSAVCGALATVYAGPIF